MQSARRGRSPARSTLLPTGRHIRKYARLFQRIANDGSGAVSQAACFPIFQKSGASQQQVQQIFELLGVGSGQLGFGQFVGAMHLIKACLAGQPLPQGGLTHEFISSLASLGTLSAPSPEKLASQGSSRSASRSTNQNSRSVSESPSRSGCSSSRSPSRGKHRDVPSARDIRKYARVFRHKDAAKRGVLAAEALHSMLGRSGLDHGTIQQILGITGVSPGSEVGFPELVAALHLVRQARAPQRRPLPDSMSADLRHCIDSLRSGPPVDKLASQGSSRSASRSRSGGTPTAGRARNLPSARDCRKYARQFQKMAHGSSTVHVEECRLMIRRSGLGSDLVSQILDVTSQGREYLNFPDFVGVMHLVRCARSGAPPQHGSLPQLLQEFLGSLTISAAQLACDGSSRSASRSRSRGSGSGGSSRGKPRDVPSKRDCRKYARVFQKLSRGLPSIGVDDCQRLVRKSGLPMHDAGQILDAASLGKFDLEFPNFVVFMHLVRCARAGKRSPPGGLSPQIRDWMESFYDSPAALATEGSSRSASQSRERPHKDTRFADDDEFSFDGLGNRGRPFMHRSENEFDDNYTHQTGFDEPWSARFSTRMGLPLNPKVGSDPNYNQRMVEILTDRRLYPEVGLKSYFEPSARTKPAEASDSYPLLSTIQEVFQVRGPHSARRFKDHVEQTKTGMQAMQVTGRMHPTSLDHTSAPGSGFGHSASEAAEHRQHLQFFSGRSLKQNLAEPPRRSMFTSRGGLVVARIQLNEPRRPVHGQAF